MYTWANFWKNGNEVGVEIFAVAHVSVILVPLLSMSWADNMETWYNFRANVIYSKLDIFLFIDF